MYYLMNSIVHMHILHLLYASLMCVQGIGGWGGRLAEYIALDVGFPYNKASPVRCVARRQAVGLWKWPKRTGTWCWACTYDSFPATVLYAVG